jgi:signal transduction histidine kinase
LSRGIYPRVLADEGLLPALRFGVATSPIPVTVDTVTMMRLPAPVEAALYFCCMEAVQNAAKHSGARSVSVHLGEEHGLCHLTIVDNGAGFDTGRAPASDAGAGLVNMRDRLDAVGGTVTVESQPDRGTTVTAVVPRTEDLLPDRTLSPLPIQAG